LLIPSEVVKSLKETLRLEKSEWIHQKTDLERSLKKAVDRLELYEKAFAEYPKLRPKGTRRSRLIGADKSDNEEESKVGQGQF
jgi:hypothetical protein